ncbi:MAG: N-acetylglucosamine-6-phosphate deacetylase [Actinomycetes bacterium]|nr:N-acetylglucosamine-6-phosphate deacetylase [Acidimicrobiia bacterium]
MTTHPFAGAEGHVMPGFVDIQVNGAYGHDFTTDPGSIWEVARLLPRHGVTAFLPTVISSPVEVAEAALAVVAAGPPPGFAGAMPLGVHVEGPVISPRRRGTHPAEALQEPSLQWAERLIAAGPPKMVTIAPELPGAEAVVRRLMEAGVVVAIGHSDATAEQAQAAFGWGLRHATHLFNAMSGLDHRAPGVAAAILADDRVTCGLIADGAHVADTMLRLAWRALGPTRIALVTDAMAAAGLADGEYRIGTVDVTVTDGVVRNRDGALAGSAATLDRVVAVMRRATGCSLDDLAAMASATPSAIVGHHPGPGDAVLVDDDLAVVATAIGGEVVWERQA